MKWIEIKMRELGVSTHSGYKLTAFMDNTAMVTVHTAQRGNCKSRITAAHPVVSKPSYGSRNGSSRTAHHVPASIYSMGELTGLQHMLTWQEGVPRSTLLCRPV